LDCFVDDRKKFIFQTYNVDGTQESLDAIADNGLMEVFFYKEQAVTLQNWNDRFHKVIIHEYHPVYYPVYPRWYPTYYPIGTGINTCMSSGTVTINSVNSSDVYGGVLNNGGYGSSITNCSLNSASLTSGNAYYNSPVGGSLETGRVEKGEKSDQQFVDVDMEFEKNYIHHLVFQLLPSSRKPKEINEVSKSKKIMEKLRSNNKVELKDILKRESEDVIELIKKLGELHSAGILTDEEFSNKKSELLSKI
jgi:hypothetical protein